MNIPLERAQQCCPGLGHLYVENVNFYLNFAKGTIAKAQSTTANAVGVVGVFQACCTDNNKKGNQFGLLGVFLTCLHTPSMSACPLEMGLHRPA